MTIEAVKVLGFLKRNPDIDKHVFYVAGSDVFFWTGSEKDLKRALTALDLLCQ